MARKQVSAIFDRGTGKIQVQLLLLQWEEEGIHYLYAPALDLTGYGYSEEEARRSFETNLDEFVDYTDKKKTIYDELKRLGWTINKKKKRVQAPAESELLEDNETYREIKGKPDVVTITRQVSMAV